ncbi:MAG: response regulator [Bacteroidia bacterium]|nr:response regulator [Bacteroidia bacterium]
MRFKEPKKIFIVDDDPMVAMALQDKLTEDIEHNVKVFRTGEECLNCLEENPNVIILDYYLNSVNSDAADGMEILKSIKSKLKNTHVIMLSSQERYGLAMQTVQKGAEQYVIKDDKAYDKIAEMVKEME